jgi:hypothetical protein
VAWNETNDEALRPRFGTDTVPKVLMLVEDKPASLSALLLAADIARAQNAHLHVVHVQCPSAWRIAAGLTVPESMLRSADDQLVDLLQDKVSGLLQLVPGVVWSFSSSHGCPRSVAQQSIRQLHPLAVVVGPPRRHRPRLRRSLARWLIGRPNVPAVVAPA